jgi:transcriptional regulator with XRE-family HTH domain
MTSIELKRLRKSHGLTQQEVSRRLGVSQPYLSLLEKGKRQFPKKMMREAVSLFGLRPTLLPPDPCPVRDVTDERLAKELAALGYPGFAYLKSGRKRNPVDVLLTALAKVDLDPRVTEALPWLVLHYPDMDREWLVMQARVSNLSNRLGFVVDMARQLADNAERSDSLTSHLLNELANELRASRLDVEGTLCQDSLSEAERRWLRQNRPEQARYWHLLTNLLPEHIQYGAR